MANGGTSQTIVYKKNDCIDYFINIKFLTMRLYIYIHMLVLIVVGDVDDLPC